MELRINSEQASFLGAGMCTGVLTAYALDSQIADRAAQKICKTTTAIYQAMTLKNAGYFCATSMGTFASLCITTLGVSSVASFAAPIISGNLKVVADSLPYTK